MAKLVQTLVPLLSSIALLLALANMAQSQNFAYNFQNGDRPTDLLYILDAHFPPDSITGPLRLTATNYTDTPFTALPNSIGRVQYRTVLLFRGISFETTLTFKITPISNPPADGLTFYIRSINQENPVDAFGSNLGIFSESEEAINTFAVEFDIFANSGFDPSFRHIGIDIGSKVSRNTTEIGDAIVGQEVTASITYIAATNLIDVHVTAGPRTFQVSYVYDLASFLTDAVSFGLSAATGINVANFDIISWSFTTNPGAEGNAHIRQIV